MVVTVDDELGGGQLSSEAVAIHTRSFAGPVKKTECLPRARWGEN